MDALIDNHTYLTEVSQFLSQQPIQGKRIKLGFAINDANPALNTHSALIAGLGHLKIGKLQLFNRLRTNKAHATIPGGFNVKSDYGTATCIE